MAAKINRNRYRLITLLYIVFVCLSVLNIPTNLLDSNLYVIKNYEYSEEIRKREISFANAVVYDHINEVNLNDSLKQLLTFQQLLHQAYLFTDSIDQVILQRFQKEKTGYFEEFYNRSLIESVFKENDLALQLKKKLRAISQHINANSNGNRKDTIIQTLVPLTDTIFNHAGKPVDWVDFLFLHKPVAISYMQLKRMKNLLLDEEAKYLNKILLSMDLRQAYFSNTQKLVYSSTSDMTDPGSKLIRHEFDSINHNIELKKTPFSDIPVKDANLNSLSSSVALTSSDRVSKNNAESITGTNASQQTVNASEVIKEQNNVSSKYDDLFEYLITSFSPNKFYVGVEDLLIHEIPYKLGVDYSVKVSPSARLVEKAGKQFITLPKTGEYQLTFFDHRNGKPTPLFEKKIQGHLLSDPIVKLMQEDVLRDRVSVKDIFASNGLKAMLKSQEPGQFPGRIDGYRVIRMSSTASQASVYNYGEVFQPATHALINKLEKGDLLLFDNITVSLKDGTTRTANTLIYKITE